MKTQKLTKGIILIVMFALIVRCNDDEPAPLVTISGKVNYPGVSGSSPAAGALVLLAKTANAVDYDYTTVADASGNYSFDNLMAGTYYLNSNYYTNNQNAGARLEGVTFTAGEDIEVAVSATGVVKDITLVSVGQDFGAINFAYDTAAGYSGDWTVDLNHSNVNFAFDFVTDQAEFMGEFGRISKLVVNVDPTNLSGASVIGEIDLLSVNTGRRGGRDPRWGSAASGYTDAEYNEAFSNGGNISLSLNGATIFSELNCIASTFGIWSDNALPSKVSDPQRYAKFASTSVEKYGNGFIAKGNLTFGAADMVATPSAPYGLTNNPNAINTKPAQIIFRYRAGYETTTGGAGNGRLYRAFEGKMVINPKADFHIFSSQILSTVNVYMNILFYKNK